MQEDISLPRTCYPYILVCCTKCMCIIQNWLKFFHTPPILLKYLQVAVVVVHYIHMLLRSMFLAFPSSVACQVPTKAESVPQTAAIVASTISTASALPILPSSLALAAMGPTTHSTKAQKAPRNPIMILNCGTAIETTTASIASDVRSTISKSCRTRTPRCICVACSGCLEHSWDTMCAGRGVSPKMSSTALLTGRVLNANFDLEF